MNAPLAQDWTIANQQLLVAEFARLKGMLPRSTGKNTQNAKAEVGSALADARKLLHTESAIDWLTTAFGLSAFERDLLLLCAGAEMDADLARACAVAQGDTTRPWVTFGLALATLESPHWSALTPQRPLRRWRLIE
ncbi:MAG: ATP-binding protein, partial [Candidatus Dechloromonas phosphoritropha]